MNMNKKKILQAVKTSSVVIGSVIGAFAGAGINSVVSGSTGIYLGAATDALLQSIISEVNNDVISRVLSNQERKRVNKISDLIYKKIQEKKLNGSVLRESKFFEADEQGNCTAQQLFEGTLLAAQREYEEKKIPYMANMCANICFSGAIPDEVAFSLLKIAEQLSYRELVIMFCVNVCYRNENILKRPQYEEVEGIDNIGIATDTYGLYQKGIIFPSDGHAILSIAALNPSAMKIDGIGGYLYQVMELENMKSNDLESVKRTLNFFSPTTITE